MDVLYQDSQMSGMTKTHAGGAQAAAGFAAPGAPKQILRAVSGVPPRAATDGGAPDQNEYFNPN